MSKTYTPNQIVNIVSKRINNLSPEQKDFLEKIVKTLDHRYKECDKEGHKKLDEDNNGCDYCYRRLKYERSPRSKDHLAMVSRLPHNDRPMTAPLVMNWEREHRKYQQRLDREKGLFGIMLELKEYSKTIL